MMNIGQLTGVGKRKRNEDFILVEDLAKADATLCLIADGMGGYENGDQAAKIVGESVYAFLNTQVDFDEKVIQKAVNKACLAMKQFNGANGSKSGATLGGIIIKKGKAHIFWVGDVKVFHFIGEALKYETESHNLINKLRSQGELLVGDSVSRIRHIVTHAIMGRLDKTIIGYHTVLIDPMSKFIICSDGVHNLISGLQLLRMVNDVRKLRAFLKEEGQDNYSLISIEDFKSV